MRTNHVAFLSYGMTTLWVLLACEYAIAGFPELIRRVPAEANAILLIDAERLFASPIAQREGWKDKQSAEFAQRPLVIPPSATRLIRAAHVDLQARESEWEIALIELPSLPSLSDIAKREKGYVDTVANTKVAWSPRGAYVTKATQSAIGLVFPPNRQFLARWIKQPSGKIADYLLQASKSMSATDAQFLLAIDLEDAVDPEQAQATLKKSTAVGQGKADAAALATIVDGLRGIKLEVVFKDKAWGRLMLEFEGDPAALASVAKPLVIQTLDRLGAPVDDIEHWTVSHDKKTISLHGELGSSGLLRLGSLFELPSIDLDEAEEPVEVNQPKLYATQNHFKTVGKLLDDLKYQKKDAKTDGQLAVWVEQYARRIDRLPLLNVDTDMQNYSAEVAEDLRQIAFSIKGAGIRAGVRKAGTYDTSYGWGNYDGYQGNRVVDAERRSMRAQERGASALTSSQLVDEIRKETSRVRRLMTERYKAEF